MIGLFDSGVGGLSILQEIRKLLPRLDIVYLGDTKNFPYGPKDHADICSFSVAAARQLMSYRPDAIVIACNTASTAALGVVRGKWPNHPFIGVVPVLKTVQAKSTRRRAAILATAGTLQSRSYAELRDEFLPDVARLELALPEWVTFVEEGNVTSDQAKASVMAVADQVKAFDADVVALACTHFPWLRPLLAAALPGVAILDSGAAVARHVERVLTANQANVQEQGQVTFLATGDPQQFGTIASRLLGMQATALRP